MITTATGLVVIENIQPGDMVLAANEETGEVAYKEVVRTFVNTTDEYGGHLIKSTVIREFKKAVTAIGSPETRFHDLRHSYAVASIRSGDDIKTVQGNLGHATAAFTLDVYGHVTDQMKQDSADRMEAFISSVSSL